MGTRKLHLLPVVVALVLWGQFPGAIFGADQATDRLQPSALMYPHAAAGHNFPDVAISTLRDRLPPSARAMLDALEASHPQLNPAERQELHRAILERRLQFGKEMTSGEREAFLAWVKQAEAVAEALVDVQAEELGLARSGITEDGRGFWLHGFEDGQPRYIMTQNANAAKSTGANLVRLNPAFAPELDQQISGGGLYVNVNDHGTIFEHPEFQLPDGVGSRIVFKELNDEGDRSHMTHVAGTIGAWGYSSTLMGMAPRVWLRSLIQQSTTDISTYGMRVPGQFHSTTNPVTGEREMKSVVGSTSLGLTTENKGLYTTLSAVYDQFFADYPYYTHFYAASNDGSGWSTLGQDLPAAKNVVTIGSVSDVNRDSEGNYLSGGNVSGFSSRGPTYDGRIKPDFTANGEGLTSPSSETGSGSKSGTSMATPNASGSALLLVDAVRKLLPGHYPRSPTVKALLMSGADDRGTVGPDYAYGWGIINVHRSARLVQRYAAAAWGRTLVEDTLSNGEIWSQTYVSGGEEPIRISVAWLDPRGASQAEGDRNSRLVNDLDLEVESADGTIYRPWVHPFTTGSEGLPAYDDSLRGAAAETGRNFTDNAEQVDITLPVAGSYTVRIRHTGTLLNGLPQPFSMAVRGMEAIEPLQPQIAGLTPNESSGIDGLTLVIDGSGFVFGSDVLLRRDGFSSVLAYEQQVVGNRITCRLDTAALEKGFWDVVVRAPDGTEAVVEDGFFLPVEGSGPTTTVIYANDFSSTTGLTLGSGWQVGAPQQSSVGGPGAAYSGTQVLGTYLNGQYAANQSTTVTLPAFSTIGRTSGTLTFQRWLGLAFSSRGPIKHRDDASIYYSTNGSSWTQLWASPGAVLDSGWVEVSYPLPPAALDASQVYLRFELESDGVEESFGWNIDDLRVAAESTILQPPGFTSTPQTNATVGEEYLYEIEVTDLDTPIGELVFSVSGAPAGLSLVLPTIDFGPRLAGAPTETGNFDALLSVSDGTYTTYQNFMLTVLEGVDPGDPGPISTYPDWSASYSDRLSEAELQPEADPDADGLINLWEYAFDRDPSRPEAGNPIQIEIVEGALQMDFQLRPIGSDLEVWPYVAENLDGAWTRLPEEAVSQTTSVDNTVNLVQARVSLNLQPVFLKLQVQLVAPAAE